MKKIIVVTFAAVLGISTGYSQQVLPSITVYNVNDKIIVSWRNEYTRPVTNISIQRSYDSSKNYTTIGSVLNPQNKENGYADLTAPYNRMYYRVFISFEGGAYIISHAERPSPFIPGVTDVGDSSRNIDPMLDSLIQIPPPITDNGAITYPSRRIYTGRDNNVIINLNDYDIKKYNVKFFDENKKLVIDLPKLKEDFLILDKVNFVKSGWYYFELYENGVLLEKNRVYLSRDVRGNIQEGLRRNTNR